MTDFAFAKATPGASFTVGTDAYTADENGIVKIPVELVSIATSHGMVIVPDPYKQADVNVQANDNLQDDGLIHLI